MKGEREKKVGLQMIIEADTLGLKTRLVPLIQASRLRGTVQRVGDTEGGLGYYTDVIVSGYPRHVDDFIKRIKETFPSFVVKTLSIELEDPRLEGTELSPVQILETGISFWLLCK